MRFGEPQWLLLLWFLPVLAALLVLARRRRERDLAKWCAPSLWERMIPRRSARAPWVRFALALVAVLCLILTVARPQIGSRILSVKRQGIDVLVALDVSDSMRAEDLKPNRITRARQSIQTLIDRLRGDRVGLIAFAGEAFTQCPLTLDYSAARMFLRYLDTDLIPVPGTAIAEAIDVATRTFDQKESKYKALILITDGEDHAGKVTEAAERAKQAGVRIYAVGIGTAKGEPIPVRDAHGALVDYKRDRNGEVVMSRCDAATLQQICTETGGRFFDGNAGEMALDQLYDELSHLDQKEMKGGIVTQYEDRYAYFAGTAFFLLALEWMWSARRGGRARRAKPSALATGGAAAALLLGLGFGAVGSARAADPGTKAYSAGKWEAARDEYEKYAAEHPTDPRGAYNLGTALNKTNELEPALRALKLALAGSDPKLRSKAWFNLGNTQAKSQDLAGARDSFRMALRSDPKDQDAKINLELVEKLLQQSQSDSSGQQNQQSQQQQNKDQQKKQDQQKQDSSSQQDQQNQQDSKDQEKKDEAQDQQGQQKQDEQNQQEPEQQGSQSEQEKREQQEQEQAQANQDQQGERADSTQAQPQGEPIRIPPEEARRLLEALQQQEMMLQAARMKSKVRDTKVEKDW